METHRLTLFQMKCILLILCWYYLKYCVCVDFKFSSESIPDDQLAFFNGFSECISYVINFSEKNINLHQLSQPVVLLNYDSVPNVRLLFPNKLLKHEKYTFIEWLSQENMTITQDLLNKVVNALKYATQLFQDNFLITSKKTNCDLQVYMHPPNEDISSDLYHEMPWGTVLKDPFGIAVDKLVEQSQFLSTIPKISLLICNSNLKSTCENEYHKKKWISSLLGNVKSVRLLEIVLIYETHTQYKALSILCPYCDPCDPFLMVCINSKKPDLNTTLTEFQALTDNSYPQIIKIRLFSQLLESNQNMMLGNRNVFAKISCKTCYQKICSVLVTFG